ncbi:phosphoribosylanthranilate isomerase [Iamia sp.]|uniref:phosphoribosylanthranilate isomerase n=1 Tax=Iamia sp. TaxID=2722710 RepID=UPI002B6A8C84|nr:phosphoribosylanthranilate isomerase [Iamia sp.]HXH58114.1 phosphoribosylanthranilate isomerase [Iamia sp.]
MFVKICGITSEEDGLLAVAMDADAVGFIFAPSTRQIAPVVARDIAKRLPSELITVGVFRDEAPERVVSVVTSAGLRAAQLHGHETVEATRYVAERVPLVIKGFPAGSPDLARVEDYGAEVVLIDGATPGGGQTFDWSLADEVPAGQKVLLAGGLHPDNVAAAVERVRPWGVDVATGVERDGGSPGRKDPRKVRLFVAHARAAAPPWSPDVDDAPYDWTEDT